MATTIPHRVPTLQHAIADLTGYEDADTLRWPQAGVTAAQPRTDEQGRDAGTDTDRLAHGLDLAPRGEEPLIPPDTAPPVPHTSLQEGPAAAGPGATASRPERARRTRTVRTHRGQAPAPTGSAASWPTSEAPASMNVKLKVGNMELMYTARDTNDQDLQDRMTKVLPWLAEVMAACEATYDARQQTAKPAAEQPTPTPPPAPTERILPEQRDAAVQAAMPAQTAASPNGAAPAADGSRTPPPPPASERSSDMDPNWCPIHQCQMQRRSNARGAWYSHRLHSGAYCKGE